MGVGVTGPHLLQELVPSMLDSTSAVTAGNNPMVTVKMKQTDRAGTHMYQPLGVYQKLLKWRSLEMYGNLYEQTNEPSREQAGSVETYTYSTGILNRIQEIPCKHMVNKACSKYVLRVPGNCPMCMFSETLGFGAQHDPPVPGL